MFWGLLHAILSMEKLDWDLDDEPDLLDFFEGVQHCLGAPLHWAPGANCPSPCRRHWCKYMKYTVTTADSSTAVLDINHYSGVHANSLVIQFSFTSLYLGLPPLSAIEVRSITPSGCWHTQPGWPEIPWHTDAWP